MIDKNTFTYWDNIKVGDIIQLTDKQTIEYLIKEGIKNIENGADFKVVRIKDIAEQKNLIKWKILYIELNNFQWYLIIKEIGGDVQVKIYYQPDDFKNGNRQDIVDSNFRYFFKEPSDVNNFKVEDLEFTDIIKEDNGTEFKADAIFYGTAIEDGEETFATVIEYRTDRDVENPELLILEFNNINKDEEKVDVDFTNSFITYLQGCLANVEEISVLK